MDPILKNLIRVGNVVVVNKDTHQARVKWEDKPETISYWLDIIVRNTRKNKDYELPDIDEQVVCLLMPNGNAQGFILGSTYSSKDKPPVSDVGKRHTLFGDGSWFEYDRKNHKWTANVQGEIDIAATGNINITTAAAVNITASGNVNVTGDVIADGISLKSHVHGGVEPGGGTTGGPQ